MEPNQSTATAEFVKLERSHDKSTTTEDLQSFLKENYNNNIILVTKHNYEKVQRPLLIAFHHFNMKGNELRKWIDDVYEVSLKFSNTIQFAIMDFKDAKLFHLSWDDLYNIGFNILRPPVVFAVDIDERQHKLGGLFGVDNLIRFCEHLQKNELYCSEPIPERGTSYRNVQVIVADNFRQLVENNDKDVFVTLHSEYTMRYDPSLQDIPFELNDDSDKLVFYAINAHLNYVPLEYKVDYMPTSFFIPHNEKGKRLRYIHTYDDSKNILNIIAKNTSFTLKTIDENGNFRAPEKNSDKTPLENLYKILGMFERIPKKTNDDECFFKFLDSILRKVNEKERNCIEMELITHLLERISNINKT